MTYPITIAGYRRELPLCRLTDSLMIAGFVIFGDVELTCACAAELLKIAPEYDYMLAPEAKAIPLIHEMARQSNQNKYFIARKNKKAYMQNVFEAVDRSITTAGEQRLYLDASDAEMLRGKRILLVDDVVSTGGSLSAVENLVCQAGGTVAGRVCILAEGNARARTDILYLATLPMFDAQGCPIK